MASKKDGHHQRVDYGALKALVLELASRPQGVDTNEIVERGYSIHQASMGCQRAVRAGMVFKARISHKVARYFADKEKADKLNVYDPATAPRRADKGAKIIDGVKTQFGFAPEAWAAMEPIIPEGVKVTVAPAPAPRFVAVPLLSDPKPVIRSDAFDFRKHQKPGRF